MSVIDTATKQVTFSQFLGVGAPKTIFVEETILSMHSEFSDLNSGVYLLGQEGTLYEFS